MNIDSKVHFLAFSRSAIAGIRKEHGVTRNQLEVLAAIRTCPDQATVPNLLKSLPMNTQSMREALWKLQAKHLVKPYQIKGRLKGYDITFKGVEVLEEFEKTIKDLAEENSYHW